MSELLPSAMAGDLTNYTLVADQSSAPRGAGRESRSARKDPTPAPSHLASYASNPWRILPPLVFSGLLAIALVIGRHNNVEGHLTPESGLGYWLGIIGSLAMLALLLYPLRKRLGSVRWLGSTAWWFRVHMMLGLIGPALILVHCNFKSGSLNSTVALIAMLLVAGSGLVGRYFYRRIHMGLYGRKARVQEILTDRNALIEAIGMDLPDGHAILEALAEHGEKSMASSLTARLFLQRGRSRRLRRRLVREARNLVAVQAGASGWGWRERRRRTSEARDHLTAYFAAVDKAAMFTIYDRLFAAWHIAHLPMFLLLVIAAVVHVVAVHLY